MALQHGKASMACTFGEEENCPARGSNGPNFSPAQPRRAETRRSAGKAAAREGRGGTDRTSCGPFARRMDLGERKSPSRASDFRGLFLNVEGLNNARTPLRGLFQPLATR